MDRATKLLVFLSACAGVAAVVDFIRPGWPALPLLAAASFSVMLAATAIDRRAFGLILLLAYVFPIIVRTKSGVNYPPNYAVWTAGLLGAMAPDALRTGWRVTGRWRGALICWALVVIASGTIVALREFDFTTALLYTKRVSNSSIGGWPSMQAAWALHVSVVLVTGILWFDWLHSLDRQQFVRFIVVPLAVSCAVTAAVAMYQLFVDVTFLNPTVYGAMGRASGTLMDANVSGTVAALWIGGWALLAAEGGRRRLLLAAGSAACIATVWASGSRTGLAAAALVMVGTAASLAWRVLRTRGARFSAPKAAVAGSLAVAAVIAALSAAPDRIVGPVQRIRDMIPGRDRAAVDWVLTELWNRNGYGTVAGVMVRYAPAFGVGVGGFQIMQPDFARLAGLRGLPADNAQNWYRHQLVEFGIVGSIGWIVWLATFGLFVVRASRNSWRSLIAASMLAAFAAVSLLGMPGQDLSAMLTFWMAAFWCVRLSEAPEPAAPLGSRGWAVILAVVVAYAVGLAWQARTEFRVPVRAQRVGWPYSYGLYEPERDGAGGEQRWTDRHGVIVLAADAPAIELTVTPNPLASATGKSASGRGPMHVRVRADGSPVIDETVVTPDPITRVVPVDRRTGRVVLEADVDRPYRPSDFGLADQRRLGVLMKWRPLAQ